MHWLTYICLILDIYLFYTQKGEQHQIRQKSQLEQKVYQLRQKSFGKSPNVVASICYSAKVPIPLMNCSYEVFSLLV